MALSKLHLRILSALVLIPIVLVIVYLGGIAFSGLLALTFVIALHEWLGIAKKTNKAVLLNVVGILYLGLSFASFYTLRNFPEGMMFTLAAYFLVWGSDSMAYLFGKVIKGPKLAPKISPNKTIAGFTGAVMGGALMFILLRLFEEIFSYSEFGGRNDLSYISIALYGALLGAVAQLGDLSISLLKRNARVKDTGNLIPGHGGLLDRIDSLLLVAPVMTGLLLFVFRFSY